jgi:glycosyltransferase involved in cell wall biosynthesis
MTWALTGYPLSRRFRSQIDDLMGGDVTYVNLAHLRRRPVRELIQTLRGFRGERCVLPLEDHVSGALLPILSVAGTLAGSREILVLDSELKLTRVTRGAVCRASANLLTATGDGALAVRRAHRELDCLLGAEPNPVATPINIDAMMYVNGNLWYGLQAGGSVAHVAGVVNAFAAAGCDVRLFSLIDAPTVHEGVPQVRLTPLRTYGFPPDVNYYRLHRPMVRQLIRALESWRPSFLYERMSLGNYAGVVVARSRRIPLILEYNGSEVWAAANWGGPALAFQRLALKAEEASLRHAHRVVTVSQALRDELIERGVPSERVVWYPNGVDPVSFDAVLADSSRVADVRRRLGIEPDAKVVAFVGTFGEWHGAEVAASAIRALADRAPRWLERHKLHFLFVGDGVRLEAVRDIVGETAARGLVTFTGLVAQSETPAYVVSADILLSPHIQNRDGSRFFGSPTKLFEYMIAGRAIIASNLDQLAEVLRPALPVDGLPRAGPSPSARELAILARPGSADDIVKALTFCVEQPKWMIVLGRNARTLARRRFTWDHHVAVIIEALRAADRSA